MEITYHISLVMKTAEGNFLDYSRFELGRDKAFAQDLFRQLKGSEELSENSLLHMDLTQVENNIPLVLVARHCTLDELANNTKKITSELFKHYTLDGPI